MTVEVRTCFAGSLLIYSVACLLEWDSENLCHRHLQNRPKNIVNKNVKIKIAFTNFIQE